MGNEGLPGAGSGVGTPGSRRYEGRAQIPVTLRSWSDAAFKQDIVKRAGADRAARER